MSKLTKNKIEKGLISLISIIILLTSILASTIYYQNNIITAKVVEEISIDAETISIKEVSDINKLTQLNEGWYEIRNGFVFYLEQFNSAIPLYIKIKNLRQQNGILVVDANGNVDFNESAEGLAGQEDVTI